MRIYELLKALFTYPDKVSSSMTVPAASSAAITAAEAKHQAYVAEHQAYITKHLAEIEQEVTLFRRKYKSDFNDFLYRPATADFIRQEVISLRNPGGQYNGFLDNSHWANKHYLNFPGPFYTGESDTCGTGDGEAPANVLYDAHCCEYVFRQPQNFAEFLCVLDAAAVEVLDSYSCDGNDHWTYALCREWWRGKPAFLTQLNKPDFQRTNSNRTQLYVDYLNGAAETDLRRYCYFLEHDYYPVSAAVSLPLLS